MTYCLNWQNILEYIFYKIKNTVAIFISVSKGSIPNMAFFRFQIASLFVATSLGYYSYRERIPNGDKVPHPCIEGSIWEGVGHKNKDGAGARNVFGMDFQEHGLVWNEEICNLDSDDDGLTNGEELGDPDCEWSPGSNPKRTTGLSHPGICEPFSSSRCDGKPSFVNCDDTSSPRCEAIYEPETFNYPIRLPETPVPSKETTYMCVMFELPMDKEYHLIAYDPVITNQEVMHHILVFGCSGAEVAPIPLMQPFECGDGMNECQSLIALWGVGSGGQCYNEQLGILVGGSQGFKYAYMQHHWNNPQLKSGYVDSSGMILHLTPKLRPNNAGVLMIGQASLDIPPGTLGYAAHGSCHSDCTEKLMDGPIYITESSNHMHLLGQAQYTELIQDGESVPLAIDHVYDYNTPIVHSHPVPVLMKPGDELKTTCVFNSTSRNLTTKFGLATSDEMCLAFVLYYPKENVKTGECVAWKSLSHCEVRHQTNKRGCDFSDLETSAIYNAANTLCSPGTCRQECLNFTRELKKQPCFSGDVGAFYRLVKLHYSPSKPYLEMIEWFARIDSCDTVLALEEYERNDNETSNGAIYRPTQVLMTSLILLVSLF